MTPKLTDIDHIGPARAESLGEAGIGAVEAVATASDDELAAALGDSVPVDEVQESATELIAASDTDPTYEFDYDLSADQRRHLIAALIEEEVTARRRNDAGLRKTVSDMVDQVIDDAGPYEFTYEQLNAGYRATNNMESEYRGTRGLSSFITEIHELSSAFQAARQEMRAQREATA